MANRIPAAAGRARLGPLLLVLMLASSLPSSGCALLDGLAAVKPSPTGAAPGRDSESPGSGLGPPAPVRGSSWPPIFGSGVMGGPSISDGRYGPSSASVGGVGRCYEGVPCRDRGSY